MLAKERDFCLPHLYSTPLLGGGGPRRNIATTFGTTEDREELEWCGYPMVKTIWRYVYLYRQSPVHKRDRRMDEHHTMAQAVLMHSIVRQKWSTKPLSWPRIWWPLNISAPKGEKTALGHRHTFVIPGGKCCDEAETVRSEYRHQGVVCGQLQTRSSAIADKLRNAGL